MRLPRLSPRSRKWLVRLLGLRVIFEIIDWFVGKVGYLGLFTSPEDFRTMLERAPRWFQASVEAVQPALAVLGSWLRAAWNAASGETGTLVVVSALVLLLIVDAKGLRFKLRMAARSLMAEQVWLSREDALELLRQSDWAKLKLPHVTEKVSNFDLLGLSAIASFADRERTVYGMPEADKARHRYRLFLAMTLRGFADDNPRAVREADGGPQYERGALLRFLERALDHELLAEFGDVPSYKVT